MTVNPKISVIVPVYNTEKYLRTCLNSIVNQTLKEIEIICIDDGSTDNSLSILNDYSKKDSRVTVISQKNKGQGCARNEGLKIAKAPYILFIDSDDWIEPEACYLLYNTMIEQKCDIVMSDVSVYTDDEKLESIKISNQKYYDSTSYPRGLYNSTNITKWRSSPIIKLYKKDIIDSRRLRFPEKLIQEDEAWHWFYFTNIKTIYYLPFALYNRLIRADSTMQLRDSNFVGASDFAYILLIIYDYLNKNNLYEKYSPEFIQYFKNQSTHILQRCNKQEYSKAYKPLCEISKETGIPLILPTSKNYRIFKTTVNFIKSYFLFPWYIYKTYKIVSKE